MNDIDLLRTHGPEGPALSDQARRAARTRLIAGMDPAPSRRRTTVLPRLALAGFGLAAVVAAGVAVALPQGPQRPPLAVPNTAPAPSTDPTRRAGPVPGTGPIRLVAAAAPAFPYALPGLGEPRFTADPGGPIIQAYLADDGSDVYLRVAEPDGAGREISVGGRPGRVVGFTTLFWEREPGTWLQLTGQGRYASEEALLALAARVADDPQPLEFEATVGLVPDGWKLSGFKDESILTYRDPAAPDRELHVQWTASADPGEDPRKVEGFQKLREVTVNGRPARLIQAKEFWMVLATLPDGSAVRLITPRAFSTGQVLEVARSIRRS